MQPLRIIARMDIKGQNVIKGVRLEGLRVIGQPASMARRYYEQGVDEILYMDAVASLYGRNSILPVIEQAARDIFVPLTVGGGIRSIEDMVAALRSGADKVAINTAAIARPELIAEAAAVLGSQCVVVAIDAKRRGPGTWEVLTNSGREPTGRDALDWAAEAEALGAGELLVTSVDQEGTKQGFDLELVRSVRARVGIPVIASGGAGSAADVVALAQARVVDAATCASLFHYDICSVADLKRALARADIEVRP
jgi:cyclase